MAANIWDQFTPIRFFFDIRRGRLDNPAIRVLSTEFTRSRGPYS